MPSRAADRTTRLTPDEIVTEALRQFDAGPNEPSIRSLTAALGVVPGAVYHHFPSQAAIWQRAVERVWDEAGVELFSVIPDPFTADAVEVLVGIGLATRRTWLAHHRLSRYMAATPGTSEFRSESLALMAATFERLGLSGDDAGTAFHAYASFMIGAVLYAAANRTANEQLAAGGEDPLARFRPDPRAAGARHSDERTRRALERVTEVSVTDPQHDEELFVIGLRRLIQSLTAGQR